MKKEHKGDKGMMPKEHWEKGEGELNATSNLKYAGESFIFSNRKELIKKIKELKQIGYKMPNDIIEKIEEDFTKN
jgi:hypothetical protein